jgi:alpha-glucosidase
MDLLLTSLPLSPQVLRDHIAIVDSAGGWPTYVISNHDIIRSYTRYGDGAHSDDIAKMMAAFYLTLRGTPIMYYGEEIGMENNDPKTKDEVKDPIGKVNWPIEKGRDGERTPMQWTSGTNAGFTTGTPWLPVPASAQIHNVETEEKDQTSIWNFYKKLLELRRKEAALREGDYVALNTADPNVLSYLRKYKAETVLVAINMSTQKQQSSFDLSAQKLQKTQARTLLQNGATVPAGAFKTIELEPHGVYIGKIR